MSSTRPFAPRLSFNSLSCNPVPLSTTMRGMNYKREKFHLAICQPPNLSPKCQHMLELTKCPHDILYHSFFTLHNLHIYKWYTDNFLKRRLHPSSSFIYYHILQSKTIFHFFFFFFSPFRGLATKCGSAMLKPKGVSDCVPKYPKQNNQHQTNKTCPIYEG